MSAKQYFSCLGYEPLAEEPDNNLNSVFKFPVDSCPVYEVRKSQEISEYFKHSYVQKNGFLILNSFKGGMLRVPPAKINRKRVLHDVLLGENVIEDFGHIFSPVIGFYLSGVKKDRITFSNKKGDKYTIKLNSESRKISSVFYKQYKEKNHPIDNVTCKLYTHRDTIYMRFVFWIKNKDSYKAAARVYITQENEGDFAFISSSDLIDQLNNCIKKLKRR